MASEWKPARRCSTRLYPNGSNPNYCQACGTLTRPRCSAAPIPSLDEIAIQERCDEFQSVFRSKPYERRKSVLGQLDAPISLTLLEKVFPRAASEIVTLVSHRENLQVAL